MKKLFLIITIVILSIVEGFSQRGAVGQQKIESDSIYALESFNWKTYEIDFNTFTFEQFSEDGSTAWHTTYTTDDKFRRVSRDFGVSWSLAIPLEQNVLTQFSLDNSTWNDTFTSGDLYMRYSTDGGIEWTPAVAISSAGVGDIVGPASATDENIAVFDGTTGKLLKSGAYTIAGILDLTNATGTLPESQIDADIARDTELPSGNGIIDWTIASQGTIDVTNIDEADPVFSAWDKDYTDLINVPDASIDWTSDQGATNIHTNNYEETDPLFTAWAYEYDSLVNTPYVVDGVKTGGLVTRTTGLSFAISPARYVINGDQYNSESESVTATTADATYARWDVICLNTSGTAEIIAGTPSVDPLKPSVDPLTQLELTSFLVFANATSPSPPDGSSFTTVLVYDENVEWTGSASGVTADFNSTTESYTGSKSVYVGTINDDDKIIFTTGTAISFESIETISFGLNLNATMDLKKSSLMVQFYNNGSPLTGTLNFELDAFNTNWQNVSLSLEGVGLDNVDCDEIQIIWNRQSPLSDHAGFYLDDLQLQGGLTQPYAESDPLFTAWDKSEGISITESQISDFGTYLSSETDDQQIDVFSISGNNIQLSLEGDGEATKTIDVSTTTAVAANTAKVTFPGFTDLATDYGFTDNTGTDDQTATEVTASDAGGFYSGTNLETITQEIGDSIGALRADIGSGGGGLTEVTYSDLNVNLTDSLVNNTLTWDISGKPLIYCTPSTGTVAFSNPEKNKSVTIVLTLSSATLTWPATAKILDGSATLEDGTFYVYIHCISSTIYTVSITKEAA